jgi:polyisoprenoid-binding protein YceI
MKRLLPMLAVLSLGFAALPAAANTVRTIDPRASRATFTVGHLLVDRVRGRIPIAVGSVELGVDGTTPVAIDATLDPKRIDSGDGDRDGSLQGSDWFDTKRFPTWTFHSTQIAPADGGGFAVEGLLTIHGTSVPVHLAVSVTNGPSGPVYHAVTHVDRHAFGMAVTRFDAAIGSDIAIDLDVRLR